MIAALTLLSLVALIVAAPACVFLGLFLLWAAIFRPLACDLEAERLRGYSLEALAAARKLRARPCPAWLRRARA